GERAQQAYERRPGLAGRGRRLGPGERIEAAAVGDDTIEEPLRGGRADAGQQLQRAKRGDAVARIVRPAQDGEQVLHVRRLEELETAVLHIGNVPPRELDLEPVAVPCRAK